MRLKRDQKDQEKRLRERYDKLMEFQEKKMKTGKLLEKSRMEESRRREEEYSRR